MDNSFQSRQAEKRQGAEPAAKPTLRDTGVKTPTSESRQVGLLRPRDPRIGRAIKLLDVLTSGDEVLLEYLKEHGAEAIERVEAAREDMAEADTPEEAEDFRPDPMDELLAQMAVTAKVVEAPSDTWEAVPESSTQSLDLESLRASLVAECRNTISTLALPPAAAAPKSQNESLLNAGSLIGDSVRSSLGKLTTPPIPQLVLALCSITGCCIHSVKLVGGEIIHHYTYSELDTPALRLADRVLHQPQGPDYVEIYGESRLVAVDSFGFAKEYTA